MDNRFVLDTDVNVKSTVLYITQKPMLMLNEGISLKCSTRSTYIMSYSLKHRINK